MKSILTKTPNALLIVCATTIIGVAIVCVTVITASGGDAMEVTRIINTLLNAVGVLLGTGALALAGAAAKSAGKTEDEVSNGGLEGKLKAALEQHDREVHGLGNNIRRI